MDVSNPAEYVVELPYLFCWENAEAIDDWLEDWLEGEIGILAIKDENDDDIMRLHFSLEADATAFKLRWK
jgi:hypothetical protein